MKYSSRKILLFVAFALVFISFFINYTSLKIWDYDFWWHLSSGRYIVENRTLPQEDPFSYANNLEENQAIRNPLGQQFNLRQYWLAQVLFYGIYNAFSDSGIIIFRGVMLLLCDLAVFVVLRRQKVSYYLIFPLIFSIHMNNLLFVGERPVLFTILLSIIVFHILDDYRRNRSRLLLALPPVMLLWANLHGGFLLGIIMIAIYLADGSLQFFRNRSPEEKTQYLRLCIIGGVSIAASAINPNGLRGFLALTPQYTSLFQAGTQEYLSPFFLYRNKVSSINWWYIGMLALFPMIILLRKRKMELVYYVLLGGLFYMSATSLRYVIFYVLISSLILGRELQAALEEHGTKFVPAWQRFEPLLVALLVCSSTLFALGYLNPSSIARGKATRYSVPQEAVDFIQEHKIKGKMFNDLAYGGYVIWRLFPEKQIFCDTRALNYMVMREYGWIATATASVTGKELSKGRAPLWERLLEHYNIDVILLNTRDAIGNMPRLILALLEHDGWAPVFHNPISLVYVRRNAENQKLIDKEEISKDNMLNMLIATSAMQVMESKNPFTMLSLGDIFYHMKRYDDALKAYEYTDRRIPNQSGVRKKIDDARKKIEEEQGGHKGKES